MMRMSGSQLAGPFCRENGWGGGRSSQAPCEMLGGKVAGWKVQLFLLSCCTLTKMYYVEAMRKNTPVNVNLSAAAPTFIQKNG